VDDFESVKTTPWEGVRNAEARNLMREMKVGDRVLFYHSNCKNPGIAGFAEVSKEAYPDYTAWDASHPYYDTKSDKENPKWYMVDVTFVSRASHFIPLALLKHIANASELPDEISYIGQAGMHAIKEMALVSRGRLSVQKVEEETWDVIQQLGQKGGWDEIQDKRGKANKTQPTAKGKAAAGKRGGRKTKGEDTIDGGGVDAAGEDDEEVYPLVNEASERDAKSASRKRKAQDVNIGVAAPAALRRSTRARK